MFLVGCGSVKEYCDATVQNLGGPEDYMVEQLPFSLEADCEPPCWHGLIPGESTREEVVNALDNAAFVDTFSAASTNNSSIVWDSSLEVAEDMRSGGKLIIQDDTYVYSEVELGYQVTLGEITEYLSEDALFIGVPLTARQNCGSVELVWPEHGFAVRLFTRYRDADITPTTLIKTVSYFEPDDNGRNYVLGPLARDPYSEDAVDDIVEGFHSWGGYNTD
jgi:hypothetical protein